MDSFFRNCEVYDANGEDMDPGPLFWRDPTTGEIHCGLDGFVIMPKEIFHRDYVLAQKPLRENCDNCPVVTRTVRDYAHENRINWDDVELGVPYQTLNNGERIDDVPNNEEVARLMCDWADRRANIMPGTLAANLNSEITGNTIRNQMNGIIGVDHGIRPDQTVIHNHPFAHIFNNTVT